MSQLNTAPLINPTIVETHPNQQMLVKAPAVVRNFCIDDVKMSVDNNFFNIPQMDWLKFSQKNKLVGSFVWNASSASNLFRQDINTVFVDQLLPVGKAFNSFYNFNSVTFSIKPTANAFVQGLAVVTFLNSPVDDLSAVWGVDMYATRRIWQIPQKFFISPNNTDEYNFSVPINIPYNFLKWGGAGSDVASALHTFTEDYLFGVLSVDIIVPFLTKTDIVNIPYVISAQLTDISTSGIKFNS